MDERRKTPSEFLKPGQELKHKYTLEELKEKLQELSEENGRRFRHNNMLYRVKHFKLDPKLPLVILETVEMKRQGDMPNFGPVVKLSLDEFIEEHPELFEPESKNQSMSELKADAL